MKTTTQQVIDGIQSALDAGPTEGPWGSDERSYQLWADNGKRYLCDFVTDYDDNENAQADMAYIAACNPTNMRAILQLIADRDAEIERMRGALHIIGAQSIAEDWTAAEALGFVKSHARAALAPTTNEGAEE